MAWWVVRHSIWLPNINLSLLPHSGIYTSLKTGALISAAAEIGAICGGATLSQREALERFAKAIGLAFQVTDDVLDVTGDSASLGKTAGKDERAENPPMSARWAWKVRNEEADKLLNDALDALAEFGEAAEPLRALASKMVHRET
jgi:geranylgeranyl pyrophosphate synthase